MEHRVLTGGAHIAKIALCSLPLAFKEKLYILAAIDLNHFAGNMVGFAGRQKSH